MFSGSFGVRIVLCKCSGNVLIGYTGSFETLWAEQTHKV